MKVTLRNRLLFFGFIFYVLCLLGLQTGHLYWLLKVHMDLSAVYERDPQTARHTWGFAGAAFLLLLMVVGPFFVVSILRRYGEVECTWMGGRQWIMFFWPISLLLYNGQVILFIVSTVNLYVELQWGLSEATCACHDDADPLLGNVTGYCNYGDPNVTSLLIHCQCLVPKEDCAYQLSACGSQEITDSDLQQRGSDYVGNVTVVPMEGVDEVNQWLDQQDFDRNFQYMLVLVKFSALVTVFHFPLWLLDHYLIEMASQVRGGSQGELEQEPRRGNVSRGQESTDGKTSTNELSPSADTKQTVAHIVSELMVHTVYCFSENIDGFSLLDEYLQMSAYFANNGYLRDAILAFVGTNILLVASYNGVSHLLKGYALASIIVRCLIVTLNNLPFMLIRIYMLWTVGGGRFLDAKINTNLLFFVSKEGVFLIVYFLECGFCIYQYRLDQKAQRSYSPAHDTSSATSPTDTGPDLDNAWPFTELEDDYPSTSLSNPQHKTNHCDANDEEHVHDHNSVVRKKRSKPKVKRQNSLLDNDELASSSTVAGFDSLELDVSESNTGRDLHQQQHRGKDVVVRTRRTKLRPKASGIPQARYSLDEPEDQYKPKEQEKDQLSQRLTHTNARRPKTTTERRYRAPTSVTMDPET